MPPVQVSGPSTTWPPTRAWATIVYQSYQALQQQLAQEGRTITAEAVNYPAKDVPPDAGVGDWLDYMGSVDVGTAALGGQYAEFTARCPESKVVLAGYSQGAMVVHRNLAAIGANPNLSAALLIADGDRHPEDTTVNIGTASTDPEKTGGAAQDWPILAHAPAHPAREHRRADHQRLRRGRRGL